MHLEEQEGKHLCDLKISYFKNTSLSSNVNHWDTESTNPHADVEANIQLTVQYTTCFRPSTRAMSAEET